MNVVIKTHEKRKLRPSTVTLTLIPKVPPKG